ncbi:MAG: hypothetical protein A2508_02640 [Candidatus Lambdaproteobacteria bacterium RIFOXYD12_FULL_49_8]|uniref:Uncharacterized protein n=1 Tax=Candidatus Lambdaproteobacteria bacterium RIFOXYD2_FULL_50_16 TaxID=1817772 RepID=A0A1F6GFY8_9PROT|nr:MAG: hypothetical protein A2527_02905 [Candidatus Lambdaproteobacteria bacterium RIFOXYD2_FULL_50_16]OGG97385.1 MAG: hypothetical protein A2508_02640 [Candidatus Lambdaproteobacteria bacterium RIFOXYD12_FULL_49_8]
MLSHIPDLDTYPLKPELRLFLSVDIVGSTAYKAKAELKKGSNRDWTFFSASFIQSLKKSSIIPQKIVVS